MSTEAAAKIRAALKAHDSSWNSRKISVKADNYSMGSSVDVTIKDPAIPLEVVKQVAQQHEHVRRCEVTHEILSGGNTYVSVRYSDEATKIISAPWVEPLRAAIAELDTLPEHLHANIPGTSRVTLSREMNGSLRIWGDGMGGMHINDDEHGAFYVAEANGWQPPSEVEEPQTCAAWTEWNPLV